MTTFGLHLTDFSAPVFAGDHLLDGVTSITDALERSRAFSALWLTDHVQNLGPAGTAAPMPEAYSLLSAVAARTASLDLGVLATSVLYRQPQLLAKLACTLDALSGGRAVLGLGAGHPRTEIEHVAFGYAFPDIPTRMELLDRALETIRPMIGEVPAPGSPVNSPRARRRGGIPVLVAGSGEQRLLRIAARHADLVNLSFPSGDTLDRVPHKLEVLAKHCAAVGRHRDEISVSYKTVIAVAETPAAARAQWDRWRNERAIPDVGSRAGAFVGSPEEIAEQLAPWLRAGIDHFMVELTCTDPATIDLVDRVLARIAAPAGVR